MSLPINLDDFEQRLMEHLQHMELEKLTKMTATEVKHKQQQALAQAQQAQTMTAGIMNSFDGVVWNSERNLFTATGGGRGGATQQQTSQTQPQPITPRRWFTINELDNNRFRISTGNSVAPHREMECATVGGLFKFIGETLLKDAARAEKETSPVPKV